MAEQRLHCAHVGAGRERAGRGRVAQVVGAEMLDASTLLDGGKHLVSLDDRFSEHAGKDEFAASNARRRFEDRHGRIGQVDFARAGVLPTTAHLASGHIDARPFHVCASPGRRPQTSDRRKRFASQGETFPSPSIAASAAPKRAMSSVSAPAPFFGERLIATSAAGLRWLSGRRRARLA